MISPASSSAVGVAPASFQLITTSAGSMARRGALQTNRGVVPTPAFMPVGTQATVKTLHPEEVAVSGASILLCNTYHLMLRPGVDLIEEAGGLHRFMHWPGPILTDSGGFQVFSLSDRRKIDESGVLFRSHIDGSNHVLSPERAMNLQVRFGGDIIMALDHVVGLPSDNQTVREAMARTHRWLDRCIQAHWDNGGGAAGSALFGICQGGMDVSLREESAAVVGAADVAGCAIGGLSVGESKEVMAEMLEATTPLLPAEKPRYLMGVGSPEDLWDGVARGVDLFDCVLPTRLARNAALFTPAGRENLRAARWRHAHGPLDPSCDCRLCRDFSAAYLHHLLKCGEILGLRLASEHNLRFLGRQMETIRRTIEEGTFEAEHRSFDARYRPVGAAAER